MNTIRRKVGRPVGTTTRKHPMKLNGKLTLMYRKWTAMIRRCHSAKSHIWKYYGGRGIIVCDQWRGHTGFDRFCDDMGQCPAGLTLERKDNSKGYSPDNCVWATMKVQAGNRRPKTCQPDSLWNKAKMAGLPYSAVYQRVVKLKWDEVKALTTPLLSRSSHTRSSMVSQ